MTFSRSVFNIDSLLQTIRYDDVLAALDAQPEGLRAPAAISLASKLLEYAAYEVARDEPAGQVAQLILVAADLERRAGTMVQSEVVV